MTGRIDRLNRAESSGFIAADSGARVHFESSEVFAYDVGRIAVGQWVTFDLKAGRVSEATNVCPQRPGRASDAKGRVCPVETLTRYVGFEHKRNVRAYRFELTLPGEDLQTVVFGIDLELLMRHRILIQDGPALCRHALRARHIDFSSPGIRRREFTLSDQDVLAYQGSLPARAERKHGRRRLSAAVDALNA
jgi:cold shock CspA family protein